MAREKKQTFQVIKPDIEITVRNQQEELACIAFFGAGGTEWDVACGISDPANRDAVVTALQSAADSMAAAAFRLLAAGGHEGSGDIPPF